jgi:hypothetical protein
MSLIAAYTAYVRVHVCMRGRVCPLKFFFIFSLWRCAYLVLYMML